MNARRICPLVTLLIATAVHVGWASKIDLRAVRRRLTGGSKKVWVLTRREIYLSDPKRCVQGEDWTFQNDGTVTISRCVQHRMRDEKKRWSLSQGDGLDPVVAIGTDRYTMLLRREKIRTQGHPTIEVLILRRPAQSKFDKTKDIRFQHGSA